MDPKLAAMAAADQELAAVESALHVIVDRWRSGELVDEIVTDEGRTDRMLRVGALSVQVFMSMTPVSMACMLAAAIDQLSTRPEAKKWQF